MVEARIMRQSDRIFTRSTDVAFFALLIFHRPGMVGGFGRVVIKEGRRRQRRGVGSGAAGGARGSQ